METTATPCFEENSLTEVTPIYVNGSLDCNATFEAFLEDNNLMFGGPHQIRIAITWILFVISTVGNLLVLFSVTCWRKNHEQSQKQFLIINLSAANLVFTIFILPVDGIWNFTLEWLAGDFMCRLLNMLKQFSMYASSAVIVVMGLDKVTSLLSPTSTPQHFTRLRRLLTGAWLFSAINSIPAGVMFSVVTSYVNKCECPNHMVEQCVDYIYVGHPGRQIFYLYSLMISFFIPLVCTVICYVIIGANIAKMAKRTKEFERQTRRNRPTYNRKGLVRQILKRARRMSLMATVLISAAFLLCWGPYYFVGLINWFDIYEQNRTVQYILVMTSYLNPCIHPIITVILVGDVRESISTRKHTTWKRLHLCLFDARNQHNPLTISRDVGSRKHGTLNRTRQNDGPCQGTRG